MRALMSGVASILAANALLSTVVGVRVAREDSLALSGLVVSAFSLGVMLGAWKGDVVVRRVGHIRAFTAFAGLATVGAITFMLVPVPLLWGLIRVAIGFCAAGTYLVVESWLSESTDASRRGVVFAIYITTCQLSMVGGQLLVGAIGVEGTEGFAVGAGLYALALVPVALTRTPQPDPPRPTRFGLVALFTRAPVGVVGSIVAGCAAGALLHLGPVFATGAGLDSNQIALFMAALIGGGLLLQWPVGWLSRRMDRRLLVDLLALGAMLSCVACYVLPGAALIAGGAIVGAFVFVLYPAALAHAHDRVEKQETVAASGTLLLGYAAGATCAPMAGGFVLEVAGARAYFPYIGALCFVLVLYAFVRKLSKRSVAVEDPALYVPTGHPVTAPASELAPHPE